jgi:molybdate transport system substrate-binding protein
MPAPSLRGLSSMATRLWLAELAQAYSLRHGVPLQLESIGGVEAARRVQAGEPFDAVMLASDALQRLIDSGHVRPGSRVDLARSEVAVAVPEGAPWPDLRTAATVREAVERARSIACSTGPSGDALWAWFQRWGLGDALRSRLVTPPPGVPVASCVASGAAELGFQQLSELLHAPGIALAGVLPPDMGIVTVFSGGVASASVQPEAACAWLAFLASPEAHEAKARHGMSPP